MHDARLSSSLFKPPESLIFLRHREERFRVEAPKRRCTVGRSPDCGIQLPDPSGTLSRIHLLIERRDGALWVMDTSRNGTQLNGSRLGEKARRVSAGDRLLAGSWEMLVAAARPSQRGLLDPPSAGQETTEAGGLTTGRRPSAEHDLPIFCGMLGGSPSMLTLFERIERAARHPIPVLVQGETGSGKEGVAAAIHRCSPRSAGPWVALNCGALHQQTAHSALFGHEKGAFTGAVGKRKGAFQDAHGGTLFLDEIAELSLELQATLLRVLEQRELVPLGGGRPIAVDVRLVCATHQDLLQRVRAGRFREDLYYRICVTSLCVPPLRHRKDDIPRLAALFLREHGPRRGRRLSPEARRALIEHPWPGNVRELRNCILRALVEADGEELEPRHLGIAPQNLWPKVEQAAESAVGEGLGGFTRSMDRARAQLDPEQRLRVALNQCRGNKRQAAALLGISRSTLYVWMERHGVGAR